MRSASNCALPLVVMLNDRLLAVAATVITANARASCAAGNDTLALRERDAGGSVSRGARRQNTMPQPMHTSPGTTKAQRQPNHWTRNAVTSAAAAMPRLPASPLMPIVAPGRLACCTSIGMPTG